MGLEGKGIGRKLIMPLKYNNSSLLESLRVC